MMPSGMKKRSRKPRSGSVASRSTQAARAISEMADIVRGSLSHSGDVLDHPVRLVRGEFNTKSQACGRPRKRRQLPAFGCRGIRRPFRSARKSRLTAKVYPFRFKVLSWVEARGVGAHPCSIGHAWLRRIVGLGIFVAANPWRTRRRDYVLR